MSTIEVTDGRLVDVYDSMGNSILDTLSEDTISEMQRLLDEEAFIKYDRDEF